MIHRLTIIATVLLLGALVVFRLRGLVVPFVALVVWLKPGAPQNFFRLRPETFRRAVAGPEYGRGHVRPGGIGDRGCLLRVHVPARLGARARLMSAGDIIGLAISLLVFAYLVYALFRAEKL